MQILSDHVKRMRKLIYAFCKHRYYSIFKVFILYIYIFKKNILLLQEFTIIDSNASELSNDYILHYISYYG